MDLQLGQISDDFLIFGCRRHDACALTTLYSIPKMNLGQIHRQLE